MKRLQTQEENTLSYMDNIHTVILGLGFRYGRNGGATNTTTTTEARR